MESDLKPCKICKHGRGVCYKVGQEGHLEADCVVETTRPKKSRTRKRSEPAAASAATEPVEPAVEPSSRQSPPRKRQRRSGHAPARSSMGAPLRTSKRRGAQGGGRFRCSYCASDVSATSRIKCAECDNFDLCVQCFSVGVEVFPHKNSHKYRVVEHLGFEVFAEGWTADEEELLLQGLSMYGIGRWDAVAEHIGETNGGKTPQQVLVHYQEVYLDGSKCSPLPDMDRIVTVAEEEAKLAETRHNSSSSKVTKEMAASRLANEELSLGASVAGFHLKREEFEEEHANDAEKSVGDMEFLPGESKEDIELKLQVLEIYNLKLDERERRKQFLIERPELLRAPDEKETALEAKRSAQEKHMVASLRMFARFQTRDEHQQFVEGLAEENRLRARLRQLEQYKLLGLRTLNEGEKFERVRRETGVSGASGYAAALAAVKAMRAGGTAAASGATSAGAGVDTGPPKPRGRSSKYLNRQMPQEDEERFIRAMTADADAQQSEQQEALAAAVQAWEAKHASATEEDRQHESQELVDADTASAAAAVAQLTQREKELCTQTQLAPTVYLHAREMVRREHARLQPLAAAALAARQQPQPPAGATAAAGGKAKRAKTKATQAVGEQRGAAGGEAAKIAALAQSKLRSEIKLVVEQSSKGKQQQISMSSAWVLAAQESGGAAGKDDREGVYL